ncbi:3'-5' exonuclease [Alloscardovia theropitheci]|uniref:3'-5' exonuclease n=1 Tax=Alloscardovia theropitheci TaxID=2496842 RepID=A0A4R0QNH7_9BIFI|nr:3'-5' exonuclease [Alloscardovia theropitheci]TCD53743.1 3'-5' exonuclease [Alloscardovia theropitheci]
MFERARRFIEKFSNYTMRDVVRGLDRSKSRVYYARPQRYYVVNQYADTVVLDTETTGLDNDAEIVQIGAVYLRNGVVVGEYDQLVKPKVYKPIVARISGFSETDLMYQPDIRQVLPGFIASINGLVIVGHNIGFDINQLNNEARRMGHPLVNPRAVVDTLELSRYIFPTVRSHTLQATMHMVGIYEEEEHTALSDARYTLECWRRLTAIPRPYTYTTEQMRRAQETAEALKNKHEDSLRLARKAAYKASYLADSDLTPRNSKPDGFCIETMDCGVDILGEQHHQEVLAPYGYGAWLWVFVVPGEIPTGKYAGEKTYMVYLDGVEIGYLSHIQMIKHANQVPDSGAVMLAHIANTKADRDKGKFNLKLEMPDPVV